MTTRSGLLPLVDLSFLVENLHCCLDKGVLGNYTEYKVWLNKILILLSKCLPYLTRCRSSLTNCRSSLTKCWCCHLLMSCCKLLVTLTQWPFVQIGHVRVTINQNNTWTISKVFNTYFCSSKFQPFKHLLGVFLATWIELQLY